MTQLLDVSTLRDVRALLSQRGHDLSERDLWHECGGEPSLTSLARYLERRGYRARVVVLDTATAPGKPSIEGGKRTLELLPDWPTNGGFLARLVRHCFSERELRVAVWVFPAAVVGVSAMGYVLPLITRHIVDQAIPDGSLRALGVLSTGLLTIGVLQTVASTIKHRALVALDTRLTAASASALFGHYLGLPMARLQHVTAGEVAQTLASTTIIIQGFLQHAIAALVSWGLCFGYLLWLFSINLWLAAALAGLSFLLLAVMLPWARHLAKLQTDLLRSSVLPHDRLLELIDRIRVLRASPGAGAWAIGRYARALRTEQDASVRVELSSGAFNEVLFAAERLSVGAAVLWSAASCLTDGRSLGEMFLVVAIVGTYASYQTELLGMVSQALGLRAHLQRVDAVFRSERADSTGSALPASREIVIERVWFRYDASSPWILRDYSLTIPAGGIQQIEWPSGTGKSTLLRLISGLYSPERGEVRIGGVEARRAREHVAYIPQACVLNAGSIIMNLRLLSNEATTERILAAARETGLAEVLASWPMGLDTIVSAGGRNLSSGQRQLVLLTAALASTCPVLLLDEATTYIDATLRSRLTRSTMLEGRTIVNVVHPQRRVGS